MSARWGIISTIKAPLPQILDFAAWHLELGASALYLYLDADEPQALEVLNAHPKIKALHTDAAWWAKRKGRPDKHQLRQCANARHANNRHVGKSPTTLDWLTHIDVDEYLLPAGDIGDTLAALPAGVRCARLRPVEALAKGGAEAAGETLFKAFHLDQAQRQRAATACFGDWGAVLSGGFLSHVAGKLFFRTGMKGLQVKIHNVIWEGVQNPGMVELPQIELGHFHADSWDHFITAYRFRHQRGSYRAELKSQVRGGGAPNLHDLFTMIESEEGEAGLRRFFDQVCTATPDLVQRLSNEGLLRRHILPLPALRAQHFPDS
ncbi:MAG: glycosyltransferase family 2 protein [Pelagimonas sp.]|jgi:hypothetical protein|nr:glycosyltransferase family 2 protein [Pelagimonas sp.]